ncbi:MAG: heterodisulfide reductase-related iron-sulfur binding cluster [Gemmatimonadota bacterium]
MHCGFCLPACPTYRVLGDEADSPRGRLHLMRAVTEGRLAASDPAFQTHIDRCLGCRACEPVCPSGVEYGLLLEHARATAAEARPPGLLARTLLLAFGRKGPNRVMGWMGRLLRTGGAAGLLARALPGLTGLHAPRTGLAMLASTRPGNRWRRAAALTSGTTGSRGQDAPPDRDESRELGGPPQRTSTGPAHESASPSSPPAEGRGSVGLLEGCVQAGLFRRVGAAAVRTLEANGYPVRRVHQAGCCGALHAHSGELESAKERARRQIRAFDEAGVEWVAVDAAGCGAAMKGYGALLEDDPGWRERAAAFSARVRDVSELLAEAGPRAGASLPLAVAYDPPCHLLHGQGVDAPVRRLFAAVPDLTLVPLRDAEQCCGGAGIYGITHRELGGKIGRDKVRALLESGAEVVATGNPGCMMQIGGGLLLEGSALEVVHPIELLDASYRKGGVYGPGPG